MDGPGGCGDECRYGGCVGTLRKSLGLAHRPARRCLEEGRRSMAGHVGGLLGLGLLIDKSNDRLGHGLLDATKSRRQGLKWSVSRLLRTKPARQG